MRKLLLATLAGMIGCSHSGPGNPVAPSSAPIPVYYTINIPSAVIVPLLVRDNPDGLITFPTEAQYEYNYTSVYGHPSVDASQPIYTYLEGGRSIMVGRAEPPATVANRESFMQEDWELVGIRKPGTSYYWVGKFVYACPSC